MQVLRVFGQIFFQVLDVATMSLLLIAMDCRYFSVPDDQLGYSVVRTSHVSLAKQCVPATWFHKRATRVHTFSGVSWRLLLVHAAPDPRGRRRRLSRHLPVSGAVTHGVQESPTERAQHDVYARGRWMPGH